jgi:hypothetical protein
VLTPIVPNPWTPPGGRYCHEHGLVLALVLELAALAPQAGTDRIPPVNTKRIGVRGIVRIGGMILASGKEYEDEDFLGVVG